ncbi:hypothetical protein EMN47_13570 [Prolixibacteraceae bacterium JC049]|nr:hypothetical protein [Prolixibacteraceae bacterium JC049]
MATQKSKESKNRKLKLKITFSVFVFVFGLIYNWLGANIDHKSFEFYLQPFFWSLIVFIIGVYFSMFETLAVEGMENILNKKLNNILKLPENSPPELQKLSMLYLDLDDEYLKQNAKQIMSKTTTSMKLLSEKKSDRLLCHEYYKFLFEKLKDSRTKEVWAVSTMNTSSEWSDLDFEKKFLKLNMELPLNNKKLKRIFLYEKEKTLNNKVVNDHIDLSKKYNKLCKIYCIHSSAMRFDNQHSTKIYDLFKNGFIAFNGEYGEYLVVDLFPDNICKENCDNKNGCKGVSSHRYGYVIADRETIRQVSEIFESTIAITN